MTEQDKRFTPDTGASAGLTATTAAAVSPAAETDWSARVWQRRLPDGGLIPAIGMGTFGSDKYGAQAVSDAVYGAVRCGYRLLDCAAVYQNEADIGRVLQRLFTEGVVSRQELFITSKVWNDRHHEVVAACRESLRDLQLQQLDLYFLHWPFPNYHAPHCDGDARNPDSRPFRVDEFMQTWRQLEQLVDLGLTRYIGMSNMTVPKLKAVLPLCRIKPVALEMELHPSFQQPELFQYALSQGIQPVGFSPIGSPSRPERDRTSEDVADTELPSIQAAAKAHGLHPAVVCLKWAVQRGQIPIPFSVKPEQYLANLKCSFEDPLTDQEMAAIARDDRNCRLIKGQVFLWPGASNWQELWDLDGRIAGSRT
ncbi:aldo/keto reductase [Oscillospiraceae bacterium HV4-5-C5C]|nr:aldo/keto reductase [Oscillospiraceae bacterium]MDD4367885.1 aldo/keto reductase [Oscillospiraceae bacterium]NJP40637.1 aldo/keto reductase [Oscillospiraceae bacterium HV4-5-C5C]